MILLKLTIKQANILSWALDAMVDFSESEDSDYSKSALPWLHSHNHIVSFNNTHPDHSHMLEDLYYRLPSMAETKSEKAEAKIGKRLAEKIRLTFTKV